MPRHHEGVRTTIEKDNMNDNIRFQRVRVSLISTFLTGADLKVFERLGKDDSWIVGKKRK